MQDQWWYSAGDARKGPVSIDALRTMLLEGKVTQGTLVWKEGQTEWAPLSETSELQQVVRTVPPELPKPTAREQLIALPLAGPWRRFFARLVDLWIIALPTAFLVALALSSLSPVFGLWIQRPGSEYAFGWLLMPLVLLTEAGIFAIFGNTLGKALLGITVTTVGAQRPTAAQYFHRQLGVYWFGLGTGFPLVSLFTMARQYGRLKSGGHARYDEGKFHVKAPKLGVIRALSAIAVVTALFFVNVALQQVSNASGRGYYGGTTWINEVTGKSVSVPSGWIHQKQANDDNQPVHIFSGPDYGVMVVFAKEDVQPNLDMESYLNAWATAVQGNMKLSLPGMPALVGSREAATVTGTLSDDRTQKVQATLVKKGRQVWRVVILSTAGKDPASEQPLKLQALLFQSIE
jgi:uncharacterized RDD family membrane protein YckC